jgi:hypothetical protein
VAVESDNVKDGKNKVQESSMLTLSVLGQAWVERDRPSLG